MATAKRKGIQRQRVEQAPAAAGAGSPLDPFFGLSASGSSAATELRAGLATFLTMAYIMFVNPAIGAQAGMDQGAVFVATCLAAAGSLIMGLYANYPIALVPGMGLNAYFAFTMVPELHGNWQLALGCVFVSGILFFVLSLSPLRVWLVDAIPMSLKLGIAAGIGFFLALIALENAGIVVADPVTLVTLGDLSKPQAWLAAAVEELPRPFPGILLSERELSEEPTHITIVGHKDSAQAAILHAAGRAYPALYKRIDWWDKREGALPNPDVQYPELDQPAAFACTDRICSQPVFDPTDLAGTVTRMLAATSANGASMAQ